MNPNLHVQAHRGASIEKRENSLESIERALDLGADSIEIDIHLLKDGSLAVFHDFYLPSSGKPKFIGEMTSWEMKSLGAPELSQVFQLLKSKSSSKILWLDLEIKYSEKNPESPERVKLANSVLDCVSSNWKLSSTRFRSFDWKILKEFQKSISSIFTIPLLERGESDFSKVLDLQPEWIAPYFGDLNQEQITKAHQFGVKLMPYTVNDPSDWKKLSDWGVDGITTDNPQGLLRVLGRL